MADIHGTPSADSGQMPQASNSGPAPVPYQGADQSPEPPAYGFADAQFMTPGPEVMNGIGDAMGVFEASYAHDINAGLVTPYYAGDISPIFTGGSDDPSGRDDVSGTVAGAVANAEARFTAHQADAINEGPGHIGDQMVIPQNSMDPAVGVQGNEGSYYDPPRDY